MGHNLFLEFDGFEGSSRPRQGGSGSSLLERVVSFFYDNVGEFSKLYSSSYYFDFWVPKLNSLSLPEGLGQVFLQGVVDRLYYKDVILFDYCVGSFVSCLVENYFRGDGLVLDLSELGFGLSYLGLKFKDKSLELIGDAGNYCGEYAVNCDFFIGGDVGINCGSCAEGSRFVVGGSVDYGCGMSRGCSYVVEGDVGFYCGYYAVECEFFIGGSVGSYCGKKSGGCSYIVKGDVGFGCGEYAVNCEFFIGGSVGDKCGEYSKDCVFKTPNKNTYEKICDSIAESNSVQLVDDAGLVLEEFRK